MFRTGHLSPALLGAALALCGSAALAEPVTYAIDSNHTYPSFEADHQGISLWRGKFNSTWGTVMLDKEAETGTVDITIDTASLDFGHDGLNDHVKGNQAGMLDVAQFPTATYTGRLVDFENGAPTAIQGELTLHGVTRPVNLEITKFACAVQRGAEVCGGDAYGEFDRADFGVDFGAAMGMDTKIVLRIQVEARAS